MLVGPSGPRPTAWAKHAASRAVTPLDSAGTAPRRPGCPPQRAGGDIQHARDVRAGTSRTAVANSTRTDDAAWRWSIRRTYPRPRSSSPYDVAADEPREQGSDRAPQLPLLTFAHDSGHQALDGIALDVFGGGTRLKGTPE